MFEKWIDETSVIMVGIYFYVEKIIVKIVSFFCKEYKKGQTATDAAIKAGYTKDRKGAKTQGSVLLNHNPVVRNYLIDLEIAASERDAVSLESHLSTLHDDRREILTAKIDLMSKDDILTRLEELIKKRSTESNVIEGDFRQTD